jgi:hypothetical protein
VVGALEAKFKPATSEWGADREQRASEAAIFGADRFAATLAEADSRSNAAAEGQAFRRRD